MSETGPFRPSFLYRLFGADGVLLYVGVTRNLSQRLGAHERDRPAGQWEQVADMSVEVFTDRYAAEDAERTAIIRERPAWNVQVFHPSPRQPDHVVAGAPEPVALPRRRRRWKPPVDPRPRTRAETPEESRRQVHEALARIGRPAMTWQVAAEAGKGHTITRLRLAELVADGRATCAGTNRWTRYSAVAAAPTSVGDPAAQVS